MYLIYTIWVLAFFPSLYIGLQFKRVVPDFCGYNRELNSQRGSCDYVTSQNIPFRYPFEVCRPTYIFFIHILVFFSLSTIHYSKNVLIPISAFRTSSFLASHSRVSTKWRGQHECTCQSAAPPVQDSSNPSILYVHTKNFAPPKSQQAQRMVMKMLSTVTAVFFVCYLPYHVERLIVQYTKQQCDSSMFCLLLYPV
ncbi:hypothetical protein OSTOST_16055, partial [Ostertagia ostertagi]